jgi:hypothetical protein
VTYRNRKLLDLAHEIPCQARFPHDCTGQWVQDNGKYLCVPAHSNQQLFGRGGWHKSDDIFFAAVCPPAHDAIDGRTPGMDRETKAAEWLAAYVGTQRHIWSHGLVEVA